MRYQHEREGDTEDGRIDFLVYVLWAALLIVLLRVVI